MDKNQNQNRRRDRRIARTGFYAALLISLCAVAWAMIENRSFGAFSSATPVPSCVVAGTPLSGVVIDPESLGCIPAGVGTPVASDGLAVTLTLSSDRAAPQNIVVTILDATGNPVDDAQVTLVNRHLEMNHGDFARDLVHDRDGRYLGKQVGMGMGGRWQTEIQVTRPGHDVVTFIFELKLKGIGE